MYEIASSLYNYYSSDATDLFGVVLNLVRQVIRREVENHCSSDELEDGAIQADVVGAYAMKRKVVCKPVDEDLYKVPEPLLYRKPRKVPTIYMYI